MTLADLVRQHAPHARPVGDTTGLDLPTAPDGPTSQTCDVVRLNLGGAGVPSAPEAEFRLLWTRARIAEIPFTRTAQQLADQGYLVVGLDVEPGLEPRVAVLARAVSLPTDVVRQANLGQLLGHELTASAAEITSRLHSRIEVLTEELAIARRAAEDGVRATTALEAYRASRTYRYAVVIARRVRPILRRLRR